MRPHALKTIVTAFLHPEIGVKTNGLQLVVSIIVPTSATTRMEDSLKIPRGQGDFFRIFCEMMMIEWRMKDHFISRLHQPDLLVSSRRR